MNVSWNLKSWRKTSTNVACCHLLVIICCQVTSRMAGLSVSRCCTLVFWKTSWHDTLGAPSKTLDTCSSTCSPTQARNLQHFFVETRQLWMNWVLRTRGMMAFYFSCSVLGSASWKRLVPRILYSCRPSKLPCSWSSRRKTYLRKHYSGRERSNSPWPQQPSWHLWHKYKLEASCHQNGEGTRIIK